MIKKYKLLNYNSDLFYIEDDKYDELLSHLYILSKDGTPISFKPHSLDELLEIYCDVPPLNNNNSLSLKQAVKNSLIAMEKNNKRDLTIRELNYLIPLTLEACVLDKPYKVLVVTSLISIFKDSKDIFLESEAEKILKSLEADKYNLLIEKDYASFIKKLNEILYEKYGVVPIYKDFDCPLSEFYIKKRHLSQDDINIYKSIPDMIFVPDFKTDNLKKYATASVNFKYLPPSATENIYQTALDILIDCFTNNNSRLSTEDFENDSSPLFLIVWFLAINEFQDILSECIKEFNTFL